MTTKKTASIVLCGLCAAAGLQGQGPQSAVTNATSQPALVLPLERTVYFVGETVPLAIRSAAAGKVELMDERGAVAAVALRPGARFRFETSVILADPEGTRSAARQPWHSRAVADTTVTDVFIESTLRPANWGEAVLE